MKSLKDNICFTLYIAPRTKKNHSRIVTLKNGRRFLRPSKQYEEFEENIIDELFLAKHRFKELGQEIDLFTLQIDYPINLKCVFYKDKNYKADLCGYLQAIQDCLVKYGVLADDNDKIIKSVDGSRCEVDKENPRIEIEIRRINE